MKRKRAPGSLAHGRPPHINKPTATLSSKATRTLIRSHHQLHKAHAKALKEGDNLEASRIEEQIEKQGGLKSYQHASIIGQSVARGGDSSKTLLAWLKSELPQTSPGSPPLRVLEVGALSPNNAISTAPGYAVTRIDLNSQHPDIKTQDFMERPVPLFDEKRFDIVSLSLVLNYVPDAEGRGDMLRRTTEFLLQDTPEKESSFLFLVLPAPCLTNSRYLDEKRLGEIMISLGYMRTNRKLTEKLIYYLWKYVPDRTKGSRRSFSKTEVNPGRSRNNFCVVLR
ncbi:hypothetical protein K402DRAFT_338378 [Aulographum hederae CBS 113979]|uniref:25S rRNA adenine-N(1) methyltransferase n=1 Tax=Aulographum hederae CBS 113979 TaxID=1176131 RepID=A0A6G1GRQ3_9PEZI|nr:hypothetical protein K402DRAFT_338378 [Aulographum hederae CBS 113979]